MQKTFRLNAGFTLIEVLIVVAILGIIAGIAFPSYMNSVKKSNRSDAKAALNDAAQRLQRCYTSLNTYADAANCSVRASLEGEGGLESGERMYSVTVAANGNAQTTYILTATAISGTQLGDEGCTELTLSHTGAKAPADCW